ncbi:uncharacterized protein LOC110723195 isoform X3 [Chenopodium quinoa]|uniref:uncharacterized protein LOC110723195 isoform X3 n=1 Tax=Chenopodium quinoa TaxID=63459 RepID=UPI000B779621|nr:uncharacterized protein LOC110723195 isoform X3 [Chenopodium quinoa]
MRRQSSIPVKMEVNWADLPTDLLVRIVDKHIVSFVDGLAFSGVCRSWRKACDTVNLKRKWDCQMPWLMLTDGNQDINEDEWIQYLEPDRLENVIEAESVEDKFDDINTTRGLLDLTHEKVRCYNVKCDL